MQLDVVALEVIAQDIDALDKVAMVLALLKCHAVVEDLAQDLAQDLDALTTMLNLKGSLEEILAPYSEDIAIAVSSDITAKKLAICVDDQNCYHYPVSSKLFRFDQNLFHAMLFLRYEISLHDLKFL